MRTFIAIDLPETVRARVRQLLEALRPTARALRWSRPEGLHITLKFLGEVPPQKVDLVQQTLLAMPRTGPIGISIRGAGFFPNEKRPRTFWLGIEAGAGLAGLTAQLDSELSRLGLPRETRPYSPHLTLARIAGDVPLQDLHHTLQSMAPVDMGTFTATEYHLYKSQLAPGGSIYTRLAAIPLAD
jgi:2'-5' RNA ligase